MAHPESLISANKRFYFTKKIILFIFPFLAIGSIIISMLLGQYNLALLGIYLALPMTLSPVLYIALNRRNKKPVPLPESLQIDSKRKQLPFQFLLIIYLLCFSFSIIILHIYEVRTLLYYTIITIMAIVLLLEILLFDISNNKSNIILSQIMFLSLNIIWGVSLKYFFFIGRTDPPAHVWLIKNLINNGHVTEVFGLYRPFPLWHILCSFLYQVFNLTITTHQIMFFTNGLIYSVMIPMVYLVTLKIFRSKNISLLSSLFTCFFQAFIFYGMSSIARSVVSFLEVMLILLLLDRYNSKKKFLAIILTLVMIVYHTASMPFIIIILAIAYGLQKFYHIEKEKKFITLNYLTTAVVMTLTYWIYFANELFKALIDNIFTSPPSGILTKSIIYTPMNELFNYLQYSPLLIFVIFGVLLVLSPGYFSRLGKIFCLTGLVMVAVTFPGPAMLLNKFAANLNLIRFEEYTYLFISTTGALGLCGIFYNSGKHLRIIVVLLFSVMCFLFISNDFTASDNPLVKRPFFTYYLTKGENIAFNNVANITTGYLMSDYVTTRFLLASPYKLKSHILEVDNNRTNFLRNNENDVLLIRTQELSKRPLYLYFSKMGIFKQNPTWDTLDYCDNDLSLWGTLDKYKKIYDSAFVCGYN